MLVPMGIRIAHRLTIKSSNISYENFPQILRYLKNLGFSAIFGGFYLKVVQKVRFFSAQLVSASTLVTRHLHIASTILSSE